MGEWDDMITLMLMHAPDPNEPIPISNRRATIYGATIPFLLAALTAVCLRLWVRFRILRDPGWDDFFVIIAAGLNIAANVLVLISVNYGLGRHYLYLGVPNMTMYIKLFYFENAVYITQTAVIKISLLLQYLRIFKAGTMRWICIALLVIISSWGFAYSFMAWVPCFPVKAFWRRQDFPNAKCYGFGFNSGADFSAVFESHTALNMVFDLTIFLTPMVLFSTPNLRTKSVVAMAGIFMIGAVVVFTSAWRLYTIVSTKAATYPYIDFTWWTPISIILSCLEIDLAMMCASMPVFWPVVEKSFSAIFVTHEVHIVEHRRSSSQHDLEYELEHADSGVDRQNSLKSDSGHSRTSLTRETTRDGLIGHYKDQYVIGQVDPFANEDEAITGPLRVETNVDSKPKPKWKI